MVVGLMKVRQESFTWNVRGNKTAIALSSSGRFNVGSNPTRLLYDINSVLKGEAMNRPNVITWTGGSSPKPLHECSLDEIKLVIFLYSEQCEHFGRYWGDIRLGINHIPRDVANTFWERARCDAHATYRNQS